MKLLLSLLCFPVLCQANVVSGGDVTVGYNDNVPNAAADRDILGDSFFSGNYNLGVLYVPAAGTYSQLTQPT